MTKQEKLRLVSIIAAYVGVSVDQVHFVSVTKTNSSRIILEMPKDAAQRLINGFHRSDPLLRSFLKDYGLLSVKGQGSPSERLTALGLHLQTRGFRIATRVVGDVVVVDLTGRITMGEGAEAFRDALREILTQGNKKILVNLADVSYIDSSGIGELVSAFSSTEVAGGVLKLLNLGKRAQDLLQITKLLTVFDDEGTALRSFGERA